MGREVAHCGTFLWALVVAPGVAAAAPTARADAGGLLRLTLLLALQALLPDLLLTLLLLTLLQRSIRLTA